MIYAALLYLSWPFMTAAAALVIRAAIARNLEKQR